MKKLIIIPALLLLMYCKKKEETPQAQQTQTQSTTTGGTPTPTAPIVYTVTVDAKRYSTYGVVNIDYHYPSFLTGNTYSTQTISITDTTSSDSISVNYTSQSSWIPPVIYGTSDITVKVNGTIKKQLINATGGTIYVKID